MTHQAAYADEAFRTGRRRRAARGMLDTALDALVAMGGLIVANASFALGLGLPEGRAGISLGAGLLMLGLAIATSTRRRARHHHPTLDPRLATVRTAYELPEAA
jgi:hypothetical protein